MNVWLLRVEMSLWKMLHARASGMLVEKKSLASPRGLEVENIEAGIVVL